MLSLHYFRNRMTLTAFNISRYCYIFIFFTISVYLFLLNGFMQMYYGLHSLTNLRKVTVGGKILCMVLIFSNDDILFDDNSWITECDSSVMITANKSLASSHPFETVFVNTPISSNLTDLLWIKTIASIEYSYQHRFGEFEWFLTARSDNFVKIAELRCFLNRFHSSERHYFGYSWPGLLRTGHAGGYVLSGPSISWLQEEGLLNTTLCPENYSGSERIRSCLQKIGVYSGIDPDFHKLFLPTKSISDAKPKLILMWNTILKGDTTDLVKMLSEKCPFNCILSFDQALVDQAYAIVLWTRGLVDPGTNHKSGKKLPTVRYPWQRYVFVEMESNANANQQIQNIPITLFNWSMTYQRDSDIRFDYYGQLLRQTQAASYLDFVKQTVLNKTKMVAWLVSNCEPNSKRSAYVKKLRQYINIDQFGCGGKVNFSYSCPRDYVIYGHWCSTIPFTTDYRFYLSFENSVCRDYVTEKFYQALEHLMVPIVLRNADYVDIAPPGSYIAADQFNSPKDLADYLYLLANNPDKYLKYFDYTKTNKVVWNSHEMVEEGICRLCRMLQENRTTTIGTDMRAKWVKDKIECVDGFAKKIL